MSISIRFLRGTAEFVTGLEQAALQVVASIALPSMGNLQCVQWFLSINQSIGFVLWLKDIESIISQCLTNPKVWNHEAVCNSTVGLVCGRYVKRVQAASTVSPRLY